MNHFTHKQSIPNNENEITSPDQITNNIEPTISNYKQIIKTTLNLIENVENIKNESENKIKITHKISNTNRLNLNNTNNNNITNEIDSNEEHDIIVCKICYEPETEEKPIIKPCQCQGSMKYIHLECLKKWVGDKDIKKEKPRCEICKYIYIIFFDYEYCYSEKKTNNMIKSIILVVTVSAIILVLIDVLIMVIVGSMLTLNKKHKEKIMHILIGISCGILLIIILANFRNFKENFFDKVLVNWRVKDFEPGIWIFLVIE